MDSNEKQQWYLNNKAIDLTKTSTADLQNKVKELHTNVRHITQLGMTWFAFFVTLNYLTMGWLAKTPGSGSESTNPRIIGILAAVFIVQNGLGIVGIYIVKRAAKAGAAQVSAYENALLKADESNIEVLKYASIPANLYAYIAGFLMAVLFLLMPAWGGIWFYYAK
jgi:hypothetical protein